MPVLWVFSPVSASASSLLPWFSPLVLPALGLLAGCLVYLDSVRAGRDRAVAGLLGFAVAGLFLAGSVPGLVALALAEDAAVQGFPTAIRIVPGLAALLVYASLR